MASQLEFDFDDQYTDTPYTFKHMDGSITLLMKRESVSIIEAILHSDGTLHIGSDGDDGVYGQYEILSIYHRPDGQAEIRIKERVG